MSRSVGFVISHKNSEQRRALLPEHAAKIKNKENLYFETGYGLTLGYSDEDYLRHGVNIVSRDEALNCDVIVDVKLGDADYLDSLSSSKILCGWAHAVQNLDFTTKVLKHKHTVIAWEEIFKNGRYIFYRNREIAGEAAILHGFRYCGKMPYETKVAVIGNGQVAKGALRVLHGLGANVDVYNRKLEELFKKNMYSYDVIVNCVLWDTNRSDRLIYKDDLSKFKKGTLILDISCDPNLEIETSYPTTIDDPVYEVDGIIHYSVDNTPAMFPHTVSKILSENFYEYIDDIISNDYSSELAKAVVLKDGETIDENIAKFRKSKGL